MRPVFFLAAIAVILIAGCSGGDDNGAGTLPKVTSTVPQSAKDTASTTSSPAAMSTAKLEAEITAFFEDYIDAVNKSWTSKKALERRRTMFKDSCRDCLAGYLFAKRAHDENLSLNAGPARLLDVEIVKVNGGSVSVLTTEDHPSGELVDQTGSVIQKFDLAMDAQIVYSISRTPDARWLITRSRSL